MRIGLVSTLATAVRATGAGSVEGLVFLLAAELARIGHEVTVFAAAGSEIPGCTVETVPGTYARNGMPDDYQQCELLNLAAAVHRSGEFDVLHSHAYLLGRLLESLSAAPMVHTLHTQPFADERALVAWDPPARLTALSKYQWSAYPDVSPLVVPHGLDPAGFTFRSGVEPRLCFLGRFMPGKGPLEAIRVANEVGMPLVLAGPENAYFTEIVRPHVDGVRVDYVGSVGGESRNEILGGSAALLYPNTSGEPFGLVLAEAAMCGTPAVATDVGAAPEVVVDGVTGRVAPLARMAAVVPEALSLDRRAIRAAAEERFTAARMAESYAEFYARVAVADPRSVKARSS